MSTYTDVKDLADAGYYTMLELQDMADKYFARKRITAEEYESLMTLSESLAVNSDYDDLDIRFTALEKSVAEMQAKIADIEAYIKDKTPLPNEKKPDGSKDNPFVSYRGMGYYYDKYYLDPESGKVYLMIYQDKEKPEAAVFMNYLPHEITTYFKEA